MGWDNATQLEYVSSVKRSSRKKERRYKSVTTFVRPSKGKFGNSKKSSGGLLYIKKNPGPAPRRCMDKMLKGLMTRMYIVSKARKEKEDT
jgi:hypothetical protein